MTQPNPPWKEEPNSNPRKPEHPLTFFLSAFRISFSALHIYKLLKDRDNSYYKLAVFSLLMPLWVETDSERPLKVVSLMVTKKGQSEGED